MSLKNEIMVDTAELASHLSVKVDAVCRIVRNDSTFPMYRQKGLQRFYLSEVIEYMSKNANEQREKRT